MGSLWQGQGEKPLGRIFPSYRKPTSFVSGSLLVLCMYQLTLSSYPTFLSLPCDARAKHLQTTWSSLLGIPCFPLIAEDSQQLYLQQLGEHALSEVQATAVGFCLSEISTSAMHCPLTLSFWQSFHFPSVPPVLGVMAVSCSYSYLDFLSIPFVAFTSIQRQCSQFPVLNTFYLKHLSDF